eukprot:12126515-Alexandrium_andersonii.AAC.1
MARKTLVTDDGSCLLRLTRARARTWPRGTRRSRRTSCETALLSRATGSFAMFAGAKQPWVRRALLVSCRWLAIRGVVRIIRTEGHA